MPESLLSVQNLSKEFKINSNSFHQMCIRDSMQTLRLQLNPHFLLNTLDNIRWLALEHGDLTINSYIEYFSAILKDTLGQKRVSTVRNEIELAENYIQLERLRFGDNLSMDYSVPDTLMDLLRCV